MRSLRSATCTSGEPVSAVWVLYDADDFRLTVFGKRHSFLHARSRTRRRRPPPHRNRRILFGLSSNESIFYTRTITGCKSPAGPRFGDPEQRSGLVEQPPATVDPSAWRRLRLGPPESTGATSFPWVARRDASFVQRRPRAGGAAARSGIAAIGLPPGPASSTAWSVTAADSSKRRPGSVAAARGGRRSPGATRGHAQASARRSQPTHRRRSVASPSV